MEELSVSVSNLTKSFGSRRVVDALSFTVKRGEVFALLWGTTEREKAPPST